MKSILRSGPVSSLLGYAIWCWMVLVARTVRWQYEGTDRFGELWHEAPGFMVAGWHSRILLLPSGWSWIRRNLPFDRKSTAMLISLSADGEFVARAIRHLGLVAIRGSKTHKRKARDKGGVRAIAETVRHLRTGGVVCVTPDGPRGPREVASPGPVILAQRAGVPIIPYGLAVSAGRHLSTWDRFLIPFPFCRGGIVFGEPIAVPPDADPEKVRHRLQLELEAANLRAHALAGCPLDQPAKLTPSP